MTSKRILTTTERKQQLARLDSFIDDLKADLPAIGTPSLQSLWDRETAVQLPKVRRFPE